MYFAVYLYILYTFLVLTVSSFQNKSIKIGVLSVAAVFIQFYGYGSGYLKSFIAVQILKENPKTAFPELFFK
jgi:hypothetical protein